MMHDYTVVLLRSQKLCDLPGGIGDEFGKNSYTANVTADGYTKAVLAAKKQALQADTDDWGSKAAMRLELDIDDYTFVVLFDGHIEPKFFGFQT